MADHFTAEENLEKVMSTSGQLHPIVPDALCLLL